MYVNIDNDTALQMLMDRVAWWGADGITYDLYEQYYSQMVAECAFSDFDVMTIVDNDWVNNLEVYSDEEFADEFPNEDEEWRIEAKIDGYNLVCMG